MVEVVEHRGPSRAPGPAPGGRRVGSGPVRAWPSRGGPLREAPPAGPGGPAVSVPSRGPGRRCVGGLACPRAVVR